MPIALDFETFFSRKLKYSVAGNLPEIYCADERFDPYLLSVCDGTHSWSGAPKDFNWSALEGAVVLCHNYRFDGSVYEEMVKRGLAPRINVAEWVCTANLTSYLCNRRALADAVEYLFKVKLDKSVRADADNKKWPNDFTASEQTAMLKYAKDDAIWTWRLWDKFGNQWPATERYLSRFTIEQGKRGVQLDQDRLDAALCLAHEMLKNTEKQVPWTAGAEDWDDFNTKPTSSKCIAENCRRVGIPCPPAKVDDLEGFELWEETHGPKHPWIYEVSNWRSINRLYKTFELMKFRSREDGTMPYSLKYWGAHTGRFSGDGKLNMQNLLRQPVVCNEHGLMEHDVKRLAERSAVIKATGKEPGWVRGALDVRSMIMARPGKRLIVSDLATIEPRVLAWLGGNKPLLDAVSQGMSVYEAFARTALEYSGPKMDKASDFYKMTKIMVLGLGYGAGWRKFIKIAATGGIDLCAQDPELIETEDPITGETVSKSGYGQTSRSAVEKFRKASPKITGLWSRLDDALRSSVGQDFKVTLPSGRALVYEDVRCGIKIDVDPETKKPIRKTAYTAGIGGRRFELWGSRILENVVQAAARDVFAWQLVNMDRRGWPCILSVHDEALLETDPSVSVEDVEREMGKTPEWIPGLPVAAEAKIMERYGK
jgi:hypothetical protein